MKREQFIRRLRSEAKMKNLEFGVNRRLGKGSHYRVRVDDRVATVKSGDLSRLYMALVRKQLGLE